MPKRLNEVTAMIRYEPFEMRIEYSGDDILYVGWASPDTLVSDALWMIAKFTTVSGNVTAIEWANSANYTAVWNNRATYF